MVQRYQPILPTFLAPLPLNFQEFPHKYFRNIYGETPVELHLDNALE
jgi:hypothetical protein